MHDQAPPPAAGNRGRRIAVRLLALLGLASYSLVLALVVAETAGLVTAAPVGSPDDPPPSPEALAGAAAPGEAVHLVGSLAALALGVSGLLVLLLRPRLGAAARQVLAASVAVLLAALVVGDPDNVGGQAGPVDLAFVVLAVPPFLAAVLAGPLRDVGHRHPRRLLTLLAVVALLAAAWWGTEQALVQRNTFPPTADPHHQAHWYAMAVAAFAVALVVTAAVAGGAGWRIGPTASGMAVGAFGVVSLLVPDAASAASAPLALAALVWAAVLLAATWRPGARRRQGRSATSSATGLRTPV